MAGDCTHHDHRMDLLVVVKDILEPTTLVFDWNSKCSGHPVGFDMWELTRYIAQHLSLGLFLPAGRAGLHDYGDQLPYPLQRRSNCPVWHMLGWEHHNLEPAGYMPAGIGIHCHILPVELPAQRVLGILRLLQVRLPWVHNTVSTDGSWKHGTPLQVC
jgi:hypothetical protein